MEDWNNRKITVLGLGRSGIATAKYLRKRGASVWLSESAQETDERREQAKELESIGVKVELGKHSDQALAFADLVVTSPGIKPQSEVIKKLVAMNKEIICDVELAARDATMPIVAITGTNGKSTTTALISFMLEQSGKKAPACGNFGVPILSQLDLKPDYLIVEISSYQLYYTSRFAPKIAIWMNLTPDHLDWHGNIDEYVKAKTKLFANQQRNQYAVLNFDDPLVAKTKTQAEIFPFSVETELSHCIQGAFISNGYIAYKRAGGTKLVCRTDELQIIGKHNLENALAAVSACALLRMDCSDIQRHLKEFKALEHRLEYVGTVNGVPYYNDSKATNPDSSIKALQAFPDEKVVLIAGGRDKGTSLSEFVQSIRNHAAAVILLGEAKQRFEQALREVGVENIHSVDSMAEAVKLGEKLNLGPVLLSPACASFDMFKDFEDRGRVFKDLVRSRLEKMAPTV